MVVDHDDGWATSFAAQRDALTPALAAVLVRPIEHIGSTAVPGLAAKPIVDMVAVVADIGAVDATDASAFAAIGWVAAPEPLDVEQRRRSFCFPSIAHRTHHLHVVEEDSTGWRDWLAFRDRLRADPEAARRYAALKRDLADRFGADPNDRDAYRQGKAGFIRAIVDAP